MHFLWPLGLWFAATLPLVVLLYILKLKRKEFLVPSTYLWLKCVEDLRVNSPFQRLRKNLLLLLQLLILALVTLALARPMLKVHETQSGVTVLMIDCSASMGATDEKPNRLGKAKEAALDLVSALKEGDRMMVISFAAKATTVCSLTTDKGQLREAVRSIQLADTRTGLREALLIASSVVAAAQEQKSACVVKVLSDGGFEDLTGLPIKEDFPLEYFPVGTRCRNVAITALEARKNVRMGEVNEEEEPDYQIYARIQNYMEEPAEARLIFSLNDRQIEVRDFRGDKALPPCTDAKTKGVVPVVLDRKGLKSGIVRVDLECNDDLPTDNVAWTVLERDRDVKVLLATEGNHFLTEVLNLDPKVHIFPTDKDKFTEVIGKGGGTGDYDIVCLDGVKFDPTLKWTPTVGSFLFLNCVPPIEGYKAKQEVQHPTIVSENRSHPLNRFVTFGNVDVAKAQICEVPRYADSILDSDAGPLITTYERGKVRALSIHFDMYQSNWPLRYSFPMFVRNAIDWLAGATAQASGSQISAGEVIRMVPERDVDSIEVVRPDGTSQTFKVDEDRKVLFADTNHLGIYRMRRTGKPDVCYAVNLLDPRESFLQPRASLALGKKSVGGSADTVASNKEYWWWLAAAAFVILCVEWYIYNRRAW